MVTTIKAGSADDLFIKVSRELLVSGVKNSPRGLETIELHDAWLELTDPRKNIAALPARSIDLEYLKGELEFYKSGSLLVNDIAKHSKFWEKLKNHDGTINSNYGFLSQHEKLADGRTQYEWCKDALAKDESTRQALINYNQPKHKYEGNKDFVCTISQSFVKRVDSLDSVVLMRSNDLIYGLTYDLPWFTGLQIALAEELKMKLGSYHHYAMSLHVYEKHYQMLKDMAASKLEDER